MLPRLRGGLSGALRAPPDRFSVRMVSVEGMTPPRGHDQPARTEPRIGHSDDFHHFAGGLPAAAIVGERTFRWRGLGSDPASKSMPPDRAGGVLQH